jgi:hypothetical protein
MEKNHIPLPLPVPDGDSAMFCDGCKEGKLLIQQCEDCAQHIFYPRAVCPHCMSDRIKWVESSGKGKVYSFTVARRPAHPAFADHVPYVVALITLDEGVRMMSNVINVDVDAVKCDMPVEVVFVKVDDQITLPKFQPVGI